MSVPMRQLLIKKEHPDFSVRRQCEILLLNRSSLYYEARGESEFNLKLMRILDEEYTRHPFFGVLKMQAYLNGLGYEVNEKRVRRLLRLMGLMAIYQKPNLSKARSDHKIYSYLLKGLKIERVNQVWCTDITYLRLKHGFMYLVAVMDWHSRYVLSYRLSNTLDAGFCIEALQEALMLYGTPEIFNTDQGSQFTSLDFVNILLSRSIRVSMDGVGRAFDNIFIERLWRSVKYEEVYLHDYETVMQAKAGLLRYFKFYNDERYHQSLEYHTPGDIYFGRHTVPVVAVNSGGDRVGYCTDHGARNSRRATGSMLGVRHHGF